jgi:glucose/arabinose dehydrogenase
MRLTKIQKVIVGVVVVGLATIVPVAFFWIRNNTSLLTSNVPQEELVTNNLNGDDSKVFTLKETELEGKVLNVPEGFTIEVFARDIASARFMAVNENDTVFVGTKDNDKIYALKDTNNDGVADQQNVINQNLNKPHSVYYFEGDLYLGEEDKVSVYRNIADDGRYTSKDVLVADLPSGNRLTGGGHNTRTVVVGPDRKLYVSIGSTCNVCEEDDERRAAVVRYDLDGSNEEIFATGLRNTVGYLFDEGRMIGVDMGRDRIGDDIPPEEINIIEQGKDYGWPYCYGDRINNPEFTDREAYCRDSTVGSVFDMQAHSAPLGISMLNQAAKDNWPQEFHDGYFIASHGSWNRTIPTGYKIVYVAKTDEGYKQHNFISGWLEQNAEAWGRPVAMTFDSKGAMYISDDKSGFVYKVSYRK